MTIHHAPDAFQSVAAFSSSGTTGAASELIACAELMRCGYHVYRCESPAAPFDLVAYRNGKCLRVEVKTITWARPSAPYFAWPKNDEWDLLIVVGGIGDVFVFSSDATQPSTREAIHAHYGFVPQRPFASSRGTAT